jgi:predicted transposase YbfD/YdcC
MVIMADVIAHLASVHDPRDDQKVTYPLSTLLFVSICGIFCGASSWDDLVLFTETRQDWLHQYVDLSSGIPCASTFRRLFAIMDTNRWNELMTATLGVVLPQGHPEDQIAIDGKSLRGSRRPSRHQQALQRVSAWSLSNDLALAEITTESKSNEIQAIPLLLDLLDMEGCTVTLDAMGCQQAILEGIAARGGDFVVGLKKNHPKLHQAVVTYAQQYGAKDLSHLIADYFEDGHGRSVRRRYFAFELPDEAQSHALSGMRTIIATETITLYDHAPTTNEWRYYATSHPPDHPSLSGYVRGHWAIENSYHWHLDVHLHEDGDTKWAEKEAHNYAQTRRLLLNLVKQHPPREKKKRSIRSRLKRVAWDPDYLLQLLALV